MYQYDIVQIINVPVVSVLSPNNKSVTLYIFLLGRQKAQFHFKPSVFSDTFRFQYRVNDHCTHQQLGKQNINTHLLYKLQQYHKI